MAPDGHIDRKSLPRRQSRIAYTNRRHRQIGLGIEKYHPIDIVLLRNLQVPDERGHDGGNVILVIQPERVPQFVDRDPSKFIYPEEPGLLPGATVDVPRLVAVENNARLQHRRSKVRHPPVRNSQGRRPPRIAASR